MTLDECTSLLPISNDPAAQHSPHRLVTGFPEAPGKWTDGKCSSVRLPLWLQVLGLERWRYTGLVRVLVVLRTDRILDRWRVKVRLSRRRLHALPAGARRD